MGSSAQTEVEVSLKLHPSMHQRLLAFVDQHPGTTIEDVICLFIQHGLNMEDARQKPGASWEKFKEERETSERLEAEGSEIQGMVPPRLYGWRCAWDGMTLERVRGSVLQCFQEKGIDASSAEAVAYLQKAIAGFKMIYP